MPSKVYIFLLVILLARLVSFYLTWQPEKVTAKTPTTSAFGVRNRFAQVYQSVLPNRQANLLTGIVLGSVGVDSKFKSQLADAGLTHIVAASGMNITLFSGFVLWLTSIIRLKKIYKVILSMIFILLYSGVTGFEPPIVRAAIMAEFALIAHLIGRKNNGLWGLLLAAYLMLWVAPSLLVSASFLLSFSAMMGQIFLSSFLIALPNGKNFVVQNFFQSFLAILFTFPIVVYFFSKFSLVSLVTNVLVLWTVEPLMILGGILGTVGLLSTKLAQFVALPAVVLLDYFLWIVNLFSGKDYFLWRLNLQSPLFVVGYYLTLAGFIYWWQVGKQRDPRGR